MKLRNKHARALEWIVNHPDMLCKGKVKFIAKEVSLYKPNGDLASEIDILAYDGDLYHVEYKSSVKHFKKAVEQLQTQRDFIREIYKGTIYSIFMHPTKDKRFKKFYKRRIK